MSQIPDQLKKILLEISPLFKVGLFTHCWFCWEISLFVLELRQILKQQKFYKKDLHIRIKAAADKGISSLIQAVHN